MVVQHTHTAASTGIKTHSCVSHILDIPHAPDKYAISPHPHTGKATCSRSPLAQPEDPGFCQTHRDRNQSPQLTWTYRDFIPLSLPLRAIMPGGLWPRTSLGTGSCAPHPTPVPHPLFPPPDQAGAGAVQPAQPQPTAASLASGPRQEVAERIAARKSARSDSSPHAVCLFMTHSSPQTGSSFFREEGERRAGGREGGGRGGERPAPQ
jgi:hypothetical protein